MSENMFELLLRTLSSISSTKELFYLSSTSVTMKLVPILNKRTSLLLQSTKLGFEADAIWTKNFWPRFIESGGPTNTTKIEDSSLGQIVAEVGLTVKSFGEEVLILKHIELGELFFIVNEDSMRELSMPLNRIVLPGEIVIGDLSRVYSMRFEIIIFLLY